MSTTNHLLKQATRGDEAAFRALHDRFSARLERYVSDRMSGRVVARIEPEDIVQEVFQQTFSQVERVAPGPKGSFFRLLVTIARRRMVDVDRRLSTQKERSMSSLLPLGDEPESSAAFESWLQAQATDPLTALLRSEEREQYHRAFLNLNDSTRRLIWLRLVDGRSVRDVSQILGKSEGAVSVGFHRALRAWAAEVRKLRGE
ncbi:MAG: sigma-70 family RNA polymerase sigma factor [Planctomycetota bacterium]